MKNIVIADLPAIPIDSKWMHGNIHKPVVRHNETVGGSGIRQQKGISMIQFSKPQPRRLLGLVCTSALLSIWGLAGCSSDMAVQVQNKQAAQEVARLSAPPGSVYLGWRIFQHQCASCHGPAGQGLAGAPDLLPRVAAMGPHQFVSLVLKRYDWNNGVDKSRADPTTREALVDQIVLRKEPALVMPAWASEPSVSPHIADVYAYLSARAQGKQGTGRPTP